MLRVDVLGAAIFLQQRHQFVEHGSRDVFVRFQSLIGTIGNTVPFSALCIRRLQPLQTLIDQCLIRGVIVFSRRRIDSGNRGTKLFRDLSLIHI